MFISSSIKERIQRIAKKRKLRIYALIGVLLISGAAVGCTFTGAKNEKMSDESSEILICGTPCADPEAAGWDLTIVDDVRETFHQMSPNPDAKSENLTYFLGETEHYVLYGKGNYETMLLYMDGKYAEIHFPYASNYMELPRLIETDIDLDGEMELCMIVWLQHGTGLHIENLLLADFNQEEQMYIYEFSQEKYTHQLQEVLSYEITEEGILPFVNGQPAGRMEAHREDMEPFDGVSVGNDMRFDCDPLTGELRLRGRIMLLIENDPGGLWSNGNDVTAKVCWDGKKFFLSDFKSLYSLVDSEYNYSKEPQKDKVCLAVMPDGISTAGGDYRYIIPEDQIKWIEQYKQTCSLARTGAWKDGEQSVGIWLVYNDQWTCLTDQGFIIDFDKRTEKSEAEDFYELCLNEVKAKGISEPVRPEKIKNFVSATLGYDKKMYLLTDEKSLFEIQKVFSVSEELLGGAACPFTAFLSLKFENGETKTIYLAADTCNTWLSSGVYYQYGGFEDIEELRSYFNEHGMDISSAISTYGNYDMIELIVND